jgi:D-alanine transaminase
MPDVLYFNGRFTTTEERVLGVEDRGFQFGDGVYEVFKFLRRTPIFLHDHFRRLQSGLHELEIPNPWDESSFGAMTRELLDRTAFERGIVYIQVTRGECERAHFYPASMVPTAVAYSRRFTFPDAAKKERGIRVVTSIDLRWKNCNVKSTNLLANVLAKRKARMAGADEALLIDGGEVREGASSSFFGVHEGRLVTSPADSTILPGIVRDQVIKLALSEKIRVDERPLRDYELLALGEGFITSTTQGVMPVTEIDGRIIGNSRRGEVSALLQRRFDELEERETRAAEVRAESKV